jgi:hypothetical protein
LAPLDRLLCQCRRGDEHGLVPLMDFGPALSFQTGSLLPPWLQPPFPGNLPRSGASLAPLGTHAPLTAACGSHALAATSSPV